MAESGFHCTVGCNPRAWRKWQHQVRYYFHKLRLSARYFHGMCSEFEFKIDTNIEHERGHLEKGRIFVNFGPGVEQGLPRFGVLMYVNIPGMD